jgi:endonuclease/exonuclease/phosphatase family metal-dependent hydrolase
MTATNSNTLRIGIYNIQNGVGTTRGYWHYLLTTWKYAWPHNNKMITPIAKLIKKHNVDIIGLAEVDAGSYRTKNQDQVAMVKKRAEYPHSHFFSTFVQKQLKNQGNAVLSKHPIFDQKNHKLPGFGEPRFLAECRFPWQGREITFLTTHLSLNRVVRSEQIDAIVTIIKKIKTPIILTGDFNIGHKRETEILFRSQLKNIVSSPTYPSWRPKKYLDYIFTTGDFEILSHSTPKAKHSDHLMFVADVAFST